MRSRLLCSSGSACSAGTSHVLQAIGRSREQAVPRCASASDAPPKAAISTYIQLISEVVEQMRQNALKQPPPSIRSGQSTLATPMTDASGSPGSS